MQPRRLEPRFLEKVWGSTRLDPWFHHATVARHLTAGPEHENLKIGEVWFETPEIPLLVKFLFTTDKLSVQVHPPDDYARLHHGSRGKTEMWHVLAAEPGARIAAGFREPLAPEKLDEAARSGEIENLLHWFEARPGDTFFIPAGTVHAIGGGLALCEIQQHSDVTYRLYDYGRPRDLHLEHAAAVSHLKPHLARREPAGETLVACDYFHTSRFCIPDSRTHRTVGSPEFLIVIEGAGSIAGEPARAGEVWLLPENAPSLEIRGPLTLLHTRVP